MLIDHLGRDHPDRFYFLGLAFAHLKEALRFLHKTQGVPEIAAFLKQLPSSERAVFERLRAVNDAWKNSSSLRETLNSLRNRVFHYPAVPKEKQDDADIELWLRKHQDDDGLIGVLEATGTLRLEYADGVLV